MRFVNQTVAKLRLAMYKDWNIAFHREEDVFVVRMENNVNNFINLVKGQ